MAVLNGKAALVTGGSRGIGAAIVRRLASDGARVAFTFQNARDRAEALVHEIEAAGGKAIAIQADSAEEAAVRGAVAQTVEAFGRLDILVNNAGIVTAAPIDSLTVADFDRSFAINVRAVFIACQAAAVHLQEGGRIITIGSVNGDRVALPGFSVYGATKSAVQGLTRGFAHDLATRGITVNNVQPGPIDTDLNPKDGPFAATMLTLVAIPRYGTGQDVASLVAFLAGPEASYITGANLSVDGGFLA